MNNNPVFNSWLKETKRGQQSLEHLTNVFKPLFMYPEDTAKKYIQMIFEAGQKYEQKKQETLSNCS